LAAGAVSTQKPSCSLQAASASDGMRASAERTTGSGGWDDDWGDAFPAAPQTPAKPAQRTPQQQPGAGFAYQPPGQLTPQQAYGRDAYPQQQQQQQWAAQPVPAPGSMPPQHQSAQQPAPPQFACGGGGGGAGGGGSSVMGLDQAVLAGAAAQAMGVDPGAASAMGQVATGMAMNYLGSTASATRSGSGPGLGLGLGLGQGQGLGSG
jgi:hypothetical protein